MKKIKNSFHLLITPFIAFGILAPAAGEPVIQSVSGTASKGQILTISGSDFGVKSPAQPLVWADFEQGSLLPSSLGQRSSWNANDNLVYNTTNLLPGSSGNVVGEWDSGSGKRSFSFRVDKGDPDFYTEIYHFQKRYYDFDITDNQKFWRLWPSAGVNDFVAAYNFGGGVCFNEAEPSINGVIGGFQGAAPSKNTWLIEEFIWTFSGGTGLNSDNSPGPGGTGIWDYKRNGVTIQHRENVDNITPNLRELRTDNFTDSAHLAPDGSRVYMDDIYIDDTLARVMVTNSPVLSASTHREIQIPLEWSANSIQFQFNDGTLPTGEAYLYVFDSNGNANSTGYPISMISSTGGGGGETSTPSVNFSSYENVVKPRSSEAFTLEYEMSAGMDVLASIFDQTGRRVRTVFDGYQASGTHQISWDGRDGEGNTVASGYYALLFQAGDIRRRVEIVVVK